MRVRERRLNHSTHSQGGRRAGERGGKAGETRRGWNGGRKLDRQTFFSRRPTHSQCGTGCPNRKCRLLSWKSVANHGHVLTRVHCAAQSKRASTHSSRFNVSTNSCNFCSADRRARSSWRPPKPQRQREVNGLLPPCLPPSLAGSD